ncbi:PREDICTED: E3 ubiquitin-protein ligase RNF34-like isoform X1 [Branchiostoma belcheri]|uniref:E3 ubiquitin-protein ligase RNF34-like isoform X1 n=1 Tax=Branchiostoma belcheri TaxID=7741 RepID=A0A6P4YPX1_BRABE|nr:PREDICTED: E3 ubiquitin-protein ligase RNF34-like isoform X1 [Branchiostoma belcheri]
MGAVVIKADNMPPEFMSGGRSNGFYPGRSATPQTGAHPGTSASNQRPGSRSREDVTPGRCENCTLNFTTTRKKYKCYQCHSLYCDNCLLSEADRTRDRRRCNRCRVFSLNPMDRSELRRLRVKDLRQFLSTKHIPSDMCTEKDELVELIMRHSANETTRRTAEEQRAHAEERRRAAENAMPGDNNTNFSSSSYSTHTSTTYTSATPGAEEQLTETLRRLQEEMQRHVFPDREDSEPSSTASNEEAPPSQPKRRTSLTDLSGVDEVEDLTVRQLKEILSANFVDFKGCVEKEELVERVKRLYKSRQNNPTETTEGEGMDGESSVPEDSLCKICMDAAIDCVLLECGHMVTCTKCGRQMNECPICRQYVVRAVHVFKS